MTQEDKVDEFLLIMSYAVVGYIILVILAFLFNLQLAVRIIVDGVIGLAGVLGVVCAASELLSRLPN